MKNPREKINASQRQRAWMFRKTGGKYAKSLVPADGKSFNFGETTIRFSEPVFHGPEESMLGWVIMTTVEFENERFMHAPDVQGPTSNDATGLIKAEKPDTIMIGGPPFYLGGSKVNNSQLNRGLENMKTIINEVPVVILEHHALRGEQWRVDTKPLYEAAKKIGHRLVTAAEFVGEENLFLESQRKQLYAENPPSKEFEKWTKLNSLELSHVTSHI